MVGFFQKLKGALSKTSSKLTQSIEDIFIKAKLDQQTLDELEEILITADIGVHAAAKIIAQLKAKKFNKEISPTEVKQELASIVENLLQQQNHQFNLTNQNLNIIVMCGVNGNGKTTTIGKLASLYAAEGKKIMVAACDTFRAAAIDQLAAWQLRAHASAAHGGEVQFFQGPAGTDPASVAYQAVQAAQDKNMDILFIDTAGRLHNYDNLMQELEKILRVIKKLVPAAPDHCLLVIDGSTGQNALTQVSEFKKAAQISGLIITKLDGTAKGGALIPIVDQAKLPIHFIGIGEQTNDLKLFDAADFAKALVD